MTNIGGMTNKNIKIRSEYDACKRTCENCGDIIPFEKRKNRFCGSSCSATFMQRNGGNNAWSLEQKRALSEKMKRRYADGTLHLPTQIAKLVEKTCQCCNKKFTVRSWRVQKFCSRGCVNKGGTLGGIRQRSGRGKSGWYKGIFCNSSWELVWVIYATDHGEAFTRNTRGFEYMFGEKLHRYYPDFILNDTITYVEVKGYDTEQWKSKKEQFPHTLQIIGKEEIKPYIKYVIDKYGTDFIRLYEGNPHDEKKNVCLICGKPCKNKYCSRSCSGKGVLQLNSGKSNFFGKKHTPESKTRIRECMLNGCYSSPHHLLGARWINNGIINKRTHDVDIPVGWSRGRKKKL